MLGQHQKAMRKTFWNPELSTVLSRKRDTSPLTERRGAAPEVDCHIENFTDNNSNELSLRISDLVMQAAQDVARRSRMVVLNECAIQSCCRFEISRIEALIK